MTDTNAVSGTSGAVYPDFVGDMPVVSPDALLEYCQIQMGGLDSQIKDQMDMQNKLLQERTAVEGVQSTLESYGTQGPQNPDEMAVCVASFQKAIASLPAGDPVRAQLQDQCDQMVSKYGYNPGGQPITNTPVRGGPTTHYSLPVLANKPQNDDWKGNTDALTNLAQDVKGNADIDMLRLQDLVSQRQQAMQLCSGIMSKADATLESQAKAIGQ